MPGSPPEAAPGDDWSLPHPDSDSPADVPASARAAAEPAAAPPLEPADADEEDAPAQEVGKWTTEQITTLVQSKQDPKARPSWAVVARRAGKTVQEAKNKRAALQPL